MKTNLTLFALASIAVGFLVVERPLAATAKTQSKPLVNMPVGMDCVLTVVQPLRADWPQNNDPGAASGFQSDSTIRGKIAYVGPDWVVLRNGIEENWISRDRVLSIRAWP